jgi:erythromycin esterase
MRWSIVHLLGLLSIALAPLRAESQDTVKAVRDWIRTYSVPIAHLDAGHDFSDLRPLGTALEGVRVVGLGEATHGTHEGFTVKHRLVEFLVKEMGFTALAMESSYSNCEPINDYILAGKGDARSALSGQGYVAWDNEEFLAMLEWLRTYNRTVRLERKVRFYGLDALSFKSVGRERVRTYLRAHAPDLAASTDSLLWLLAAEEYNWPSRVNQKALRSTLVPLRALKNYLESNKQRLERASSPRELEQVAKYVEVMEQGVLIAVTEVPPAFASQKKDRDDYQWENLKYLMSRERPGTKFMIWEHNVHIATRSPSVGSHLRQALGNGYYALAIVADTGTFQARVVTPEGFWAELKADTLNHGGNALAELFNAAGSGQRFLDMRHAPRSDVLNAWSHSPVRMASGNWGYRGASANFATFVVGEEFDGLLYFPHSTPVRPTRNALELSARWIGF